MFGIFLILKKNKKNLEIVLERKGIIPYELTIGMDWFLLVPEKYFWEKTEFFTNLKQSAVNDVYYESSKYLYQSLKIRNLGDK